MAEPRWTTTVAAIDIHTDQIRQHGGSQGLRDYDGLEAAMARPRQKWAYGDPDLQALGAAYAFGIAKRHPFVDGNKRTAFQVMAVFLFKNGWLLDAPERDAARMMRDLASAACSEEDLAEWIRENSSEIT